MSKLIYKSDKPYQEDINDLVEESIEKGRGPDKQPRKKRGDGSSDFNSRFDAAVEADKKNNPKYYDKTHPEYKPTSGIKIR